MSTWLNPDQVAERLGVKRRTAMAMMMQMPHSIISGKHRQRVRVSEEQLEAWLLKRSTGKPIQTKSVGSNRRLTRREV